MRTLSIIGALALSAVCAAGTHAAEKPGDKPDPEMLRMMEFLRDWEMLKNMEMLREMQQVGAETKSSAPNTANAAPTKRKESAK